MAETPSANSVLLALADVHSEKLKRLHGIWLDRRGARRWPQRSDIRPEDIAFMLGTVNLVEVVGAPPRFRLRLVGSALEEIGRRGEQGKMIDEIEPADYAAIVAADYRAVLAAGEPLFHCITFLPEARPSRHPLVYERVALPLSADGVAIDMLLAASDWSQGLSADPRRFHGA